MKIRPIAFLILLLLVVTTGLGQDIARIKGLVTDNQGRPLAGVSISIKGKAVGAATSGSGSYEIPVPAGEDIAVSFSSIGLTTQTITVRLDPGETKSLNIAMEIGTTPLPEIEIRDKRREPGSIISINPRSLTELPNTTGSFEAVLKTLPGVVSNNELSSQYSVRGGNFDENLVYVNDIEVFRPLLIRSGQQEGLSFINADLVSTVKFSAGGFDAIYGDKLSSVLDVKYKNPTRFGGSAYASLLGAGFHLEGISKSKKLTYMLGVRRKTTQYLLNSLETKGEYKPSFSDFQALINWKLNERNDLTFLGNYSANKYEIIPVDRKTEFGTINQALRLSIYFDGKEIDSYNSGTAALALRHKFSDDSWIKFIASTYKSIESERFDLLGQYYIDELEKDLGSDAFGESASNLGVGSFLEHARNDLEATIYNGEFKGYWEKGNKILQYGAQARMESFNDKLSEWEYIDSAGFALPHPPDNVGQPGNPSQIIQMQELVKTDTALTNFRFSSYIMGSWALGKSETFSLNAGLRFTSRTLSNEFLVSPRAGITFDPEWKRNVVFRISTGVYYQPPLYREMRDYEGKINTNLKSQRSIHFVLGGDYTFLAWGREFKFMTEVYYKKLDNLVPYKVENLRLRYFANNKSSGYATGVDFRINGEFVQGVESWASLSLLKTEEDIEGDVYYTYFNNEGQQIIPGYTFNDTPVDSVANTPGRLARPTDQRVTFSLFFQDYLPKFPSYRMNMTLVYGTGLPFGPPGPDRYKDKLRFPSYRRVDIGFSKTIIDEDKPNNSRLRLFRKLNYLSLGLEVFNLLQVNNTVSYLWVTDVTDRTYAVPNYLSSRTINLRITTRF
ncbi:MAG: TonB-dependent receptor [Bacteroidota bacterium]|jgi:hypothetical protein